MFVKFSRDRYPTWYALRLLLGSRAGVAYHKTQSQVVAIADTRVNLLAEIGFILTCWKLSHSTFRKRSVWIIKVDIGKHTWISKQIVLSLNSVDKFGELYRR